MIRPRRAPGGDGRIRPVRAGDLGSGLLAATAALLVLACGDGGEDASRPLSDTVYVEVMARLVVLDSALAPPSDLPGGEAAADSLRARVLEEWEVDADRLLEYARVRGGDPERMEAVWRRVHELSDSLGAAGWTPDRPGEAGTGRRDAGAPSDTPDAASDSPAAPTDTLDGTASTDTVAAAEDPPDTPGGAGSPPRRAVRDAPRGPAADRP